MEPPRARLRQLLERGIQRGDLPAALHVEVSMALLLGPIMYRFAAGPSVTNLPDDLPRRIVEAFWNAYAVRLSTRRAS